MAKKSAGIWEKEVGSRVKNMRLERKLTQKQLAEMVHVSSSCITRLETGESMVSIYTMKDIAAVFNVSIAELVETTEEFRCKEFDGLIIKVEKLPKKSRTAILKNFEGIVDTFFFEN